MRFQCFMFLLILLLESSGCVSVEQLQRYREATPDTSGFAIQHHPQLRLQANDVLSIKVFSTEMALAAPFNISSSPQNEAYVNVESIQLSGYLLNQDGMIDFPVLGALNLRGLTIGEAKQLILEKLKDHLKDAVVNIRLLNFRVSVSGEVRNPGAFNIFSERITLPEALALAGDLTDYADRTDILLVREKDGKRTNNHINLQSTAFFQTEFYYLKQNDLLYVKPAKQKAGSIQDQSSKVVPILSALGTLAAILVALFK